MSAQNIQLDLSAIQKKFGHQTILRNVDLSLSGGQCKLLCGENGAGKTTLLRIAAGLEKPDSGYVNTGLGKVSWKFCRKTLQEKIVYLHQQPYMLDGTVMYNLKFSARDKQKDKRKAAIEKAMAWAGLETLASRKAKTLSGGEKQRVAIARAWLRNPLVMLLDEPTANMDTDARRRTLELMFQLKEQGLALLIATHDPMQFKKLSDACLILNNGEIKTDIDVEYTEGPVVSIHQHQAK